MNTEFERVPTQDVVLVLTHIQNDFWHPDGRGYEFTRDTLPFPDTKEILDGSHPKAIRRGLGPTRPLSVGRLAQASVEDNIDGWSWLLRYGITWLSRVLVLQGAEKKLNKTHGLVVVGKASFEAWDNHSRITPLERR